jgi:predicted negative regulator of RcsB-dependent stress response
VYEHYGDILYRTGDTPAAIEAWKMSVAAGNNSESIKQKIAQQKLAE